MSQTVCRVCEEMLEQGHALCLECHHAGDAVAPRLEEAGGERFAGYRLEKLLGTGGHGEVWRAHHLLTDQHVALKRLSPELRDNRLEVRKFRKEIQLHSRFRQGNVVAVLGAAHYCGWYYYTMPLMESDLEARLDRYANNPRAAAALVAKVARILQPFHDRRVVHQDLHPGNILFDSQETPFLSDFGEAQEQFGETISGTEAESGLSDTPDFDDELESDEPLEDSDGIDPPDDENHAVISLLPARRGLEPPADSSVARPRSSSPANRAPEQRQGGRRTRAIDLYQLGVLLGQLVSQRHPRTWNASNAPTDSSREHLSVTATRSDAPASAAQLGRLEPASIGSSQAPAAEECLRAPDGLDPDIKAIVTWCLEPDWRKRLQNYASVTELAEDLERYCQGQPTRANPRGWAAELWSRFRREKRWILPQLLVLIFVLGLTNCWTLREEERELGFLEQLVTEDVQRLREMIELQIGRYAATVNQAAAVVDAEALSVGDRERLQDWGRKQDRASGDLVGSAIERMARRPFDRWYVLDASGTMRAIFPPKGVEGIDFFERDYFQGAWVKGNRSEAVPYVSRAFEATCDHVFKFAISAPVLREDRLLGVAVASVPADSNLLTLNLQRSNRTVMIVAERDPADQGTPTWRSADDNCSSLSGKSARRDRPWLPYLLMVHPALQPNGALPLPASRPTDAEQPLWELRDFEVHTSRSFIDPLLGLEQDVSDLLLPEYQFGTAAQLKHRDVRRVSAAAKLHNAPMIVIVEAAAQRSLVTRYLYTSILILVLDLLVIVLLALRRRDGPARTGVTTA